jgi:hypothetical protein
MAQYALDHFAMIAITTTIIPKAPHNLAHAKSTIV